MIKRRAFIRGSMLSSMSLMLGKLVSCKEPLERNTGSQKNTISHPIVISTWEPNTAANNAAWEILSNGGYVIDAIEAGIWVPESDVEDTSVGYGGFPDRYGDVTLDACIMDENGNCGAVMCLEGFKHPISIAKKVLENSPHVYLVGKGAAEFAISQGFSSQNLLSEKAHEEWVKWKEKGAYDPMLTPRALMERIEDNHDTIGMLAIDKKGRIAGGCSTSGLGFKARGRVGDSPIIGSGLFVDPEVGAATATGLGEEIAKVCGAMVVIEEMRRGATPTEACREAVNRIVKKDKELAKEIQACFIALSKDGEHGAFAINEKFTYAVRDSEGESVIHSPHWF